jgi:hypothetical protein
LNINLTRQQLAILGGLLLAGYFVFCAFGCVLGMGIAGTQEPTAVDVAQRPISPSDTPTPVPTSIPTLTSEPSIPEATRQQIFYDLVAAEDSGIGSEKAREVVAQQYGITMDQVEEIAEEGLMNQWPMPLVPTDKPTATLTPNANDEMIAAVIEIACSPYGVTDVSIADGRSAGGDRTAIVTLETDTSDLDKVFSGLGAVFGAAYEASTGQLEGDLDAVFIIVGNMNGMATAMVGTYMSDIEAWKAGGITDEQFINTWITTDF